MEDGTSTVYLLGELPEDHPRYWDFIKGHLSVKWARLGDRNLQVIHAARFESDKAGRHFLVLQIGEQPASQDLRLELNRAECLSGQMLIKGIRPKPDTGTLEDGITGTKSQPSGGL